MAKKKIVIWDPKAFARTSHQVRMSYETRIYWPAPQISNPLIDAKGAKKIPLQDFDLESKME
jgi:hypothetical protein